MRSAIDLYVIEKVKEKREAAELSQEELSIRAGFKSNGFVGQVESPNYTKRYNIQHLNKFAAVFNCSPRDFLPETAL
ncbi:transcriptional regulator [Niastella vici]|uniref:Transcriptional regulator n=1 Tax=Niastella vici TaxID=1703345 RepID=A0A1V9G5I0_9BACT|nr:helix-turn-helix transcriptional regulator [Niastella vici]OQP65837.1 transcriptional regulator [Niastella vici]